MVKQLLVGIVCLLYFTSCFQRPIQKEGLVYIKSNMFNGKAEIDRIWFKDSLLIHEVKIFNSVESDSDTGVVVSNSYDVFKYSFQDLRNSHCQDYRYFQDTASVLTNYFLKPNEILSNDIVSGRTMHMNVNDYTQISDTVLNNIKYKRVQYIDSFNVALIFYMQCNGSNNIFHLAKLVENLYPSCKIVRNETHDLNHVMPMLFFEYEIVRVKLTNEEKKIFAQWSKNATETKLPVITMQEAIKNTVPQYHPN